MAAKASTAVGSAQWISTEKENVLQLLEQEKEELIYPAQHEMEWLNEHLAEIFSRNRVNFTDVFKTPGKVRGKTPRTARKRNMNEARAPLSDIFSSKTQMKSPVKSKLLRNGPAFTIAQDEEQNRDVAPAPQQQSMNAQADSGYHGSSQNEFHVGSSVPTSARKATTRISHGEEHQQCDDISQERRTTEGSFHTAKEQQTAKLVLQIQGSNEPLECETVEAMVPEQLENQQADERAKEGNDFDDIGSPSDESTPDKPMLRKKSSLTFAALPAREPLKTSIGARVSRTSHLEQSRQHGASRSSYMGRSAGGHQIKESDADDTDEDEDAEISEGSHLEILGHDDSDSDSRATKLHNKSSTQRLHDKISMLGKAAPPRPSKSIPSAAALAASHLRQSAAASKMEKEAGRYDEDDSWIKPLKSSGGRQRPIVTKSYTIDVNEGLDDHVDNDSEDEKEFDLRAPELIAYEDRTRTPRISPSPGKAFQTFHKKSASTATLASPGKTMMAPPLSPVRTISVPNSSTTPKGSPNRMMAPLSASKSKLQSIMKTAKGLFSSSASVSAAAKMETLSPRAMHRAAGKMPGIYPSMQSMLEDKPLPASPREVRKTRSSIEKEKEGKKVDAESKVIQKLPHQLEKVQEKERQKATQFKQIQDDASTAKPLPELTRVSPRRLAAQQIEPDQDHEAGDIGPSGMQQQSSKLSRPTKPSRDMAPKARPQPVAIRVGTLSQRMPITTASLASNLQETLSTEPKRPVMTKKTSTASMTSSTGFKASVTTHPVKPRALLAAERKKEQDEREAQRKLEQKREIERKRGAQQEEAKRHEQRQRIEVERKERERLAAEQAKRQAQQQAIEKKRLENTRKVEQQRADRAAIDATRSQSRLGSAQPPSRSLINHNLPTNPAKPAKRPLEEDAGTSRPQAPRFGNASQQADAKRRRTEDEDAIQQVPRPTMSGAPVRQSNLGKKPSIFNHSAYAPAPPAHHIQSQLGQFPQPPNPRLAHPNTMAQYANGAKIPFADAPNPPLHANKTPSSAYQQKPGIQLVKSSPQYQNGDVIFLPEIPTDSEDEDSDSESKAFPIPDWATPGHLTEQLLRQEGLDGDAVFGPIAPLKMEEIFAKGNKERLKRMRERTSSANWAMSGDGLTLEEVRSDREQREKMRREGGWRYGNGS